jgi:hypothetical protein
VRFCNGSHAISYSEPHTFFILGRFQGCTDGYHIKLRIFMHIAEDIETNFELLKFYSHGAGI